MLRADGKPLKFKQSTVSNLVEFLSNFSFRNVTDDHELQHLVKRARELLQGWKRMTYARSATCAPKFCKECQISPPRSTGCSRNPANGNFV